MAWNVHRAALIRRAFDLGTITDRKYRSLNIQLSRAGYKQREPIETDPEREPTTLMENLLEYHMRDLSFAVQELANYLHVNVDDLLGTYPISAPFHSGSPRPVLRVVPR